MAISNPLDGFYNMRKWVAWLFCSFLVALLITDVLFVRQNRNLKRALSQGPPALGPPIGAIIPPIKGVDLKGQTVRLDWGADTRDTFLFVFSPHCGVCAETWPTWRALVGSTQTALHRLVYVNMLPPLKEDYVKKWGLEDSLVIAELDPQSIVSTNIRMTPEVVRVSSSGKIEQTWIGLIEGEDLATLKRALGK